MDRIACMEAFVRVIDEGSFSRAAGRLSISPPMVTKCVGALEARLGTRLINRSTRRLSLTEAGRVYVEHCRQVLADLADADAAVGDFSRVPRGTLRVTIPQDFSERYLNKVLLSFTERFPQISLETDASARMVDVIEEGFDAAIRITPNPSGNLASRKLATTRYVVCAAPSYLKSHGIPRLPGDLERHNCLQYVRNSVGDQWFFRQGEQITSVRLRGNLRTNDVNLLKRATLQGNGVHMAASFVVSEELADGRLLALLPGFDTHALGIYAMFPERRFLAAKVRAFVDYLVAHFGSDPERDPWLPVGMKYAVDAKSIRTKPIKSKR